MDLRTEPLPSLEGSGGDGSGWLPKHPIVGGGSYVVVVKHRTTLPNSRHSSKQPNILSKDTQAHFIHSRLREGRFEQWNVYNHFHSKPKVLI